MLNNDNRDENKNENKDVESMGKISNSIASLVVFLFIFLFLFILDSGYGYFLESKKENDLTLDNITLSSYTIEEELRCVGITAVYEVDGTKNYNVRFRVPKYDIYVDGVVPASMVEESKIVDKDSLYKAKVTYTYPNEVVEELKSKNLDSKNYENDYDYLKNVENIEVAIQISDIDCIFSEYLELLSEEEIKTLFEKNLIIKK